MEVCEGGAKIEHEDGETLSEVEELERSPISSLKMFASVAAGTMLGMPYFPASTFRGAWAGVSEYSRFTRLVTRKYKISLTKDLRSRP